MTIVRSFSKRFSAADSTSDATVLSSVLGFGKSVGNSVEKFFSSCSTWDSNSTGSTDVNAAKGSLRSCSSSNVTSSPFRIFARVFIFSSKSSFLVWESSASLISSWIVASSSSVAFLILSANCCVSRSVLRCFCSAFLTLSRSCNFFSAAFLNSGSSIVSIKFLTWAIEVVFSNSFKAVCTSCFLAIFSAAFVWYSLLVIVENSLSAFKRILDILSKASWYPSSFLKLSKDSTSFKNLL